MKRNVWKIIISLLIITALILFSWWNSPLNKTTRELEENLANAILGETGTGEDLFSFEYDFLYVFEPYQSNAKMEKQIGFKTRILEETVNEGMMNLLFVKDQKPVAYLYGYPSNTKYNIELLPGSYNQSAINSLEYIVTETDLGNSSGEPIIYMNYEFQP